MLCLGYRWNQIMSVWVEWLERLTLGFSPTKRSRVKQAKKAGLIDHPLDHFQVSQSMGQTPLHRAVRQNDLDEVRRLLRQGMAIDGLDGQGQTPLGLAVDLGYIFIVRALTAQGANPLHRCSDGQTILEHGLHHAHPLMSAWAQDWNKAMLSRR